MAFLERLVIDLLLRFWSVEQLNAALSDPRTVALIVGGLVAVATALPGVILLLRKSALTADAISHSVLFGIVVAFLVMLALGADPDLSSPWLIVGAAAAGVITVVLTEAIQRSGLVKADAALGLVFPFLFAAAVIMVTRYIPNVHLDADAVMVGEIGAAWANTNSYCLDHCDEVIITPEHPKAEVGRRCLNCTPGGITPRDPRAQFEALCANCGTYSAAEAWRLRLIDAPPALIFFPRAIITVGLAALINVLFVILLYKELKLSTFDPALARSFGFRPGLISLALMALVSLTAVAAFDAVGAVLVVAFFIIPAGTAYLLTDRLWRMYLIAAVVGIVAVIGGYDLARGYLMGFEINRLLEMLDKLIGLGGYTEWNVSISASMVVFMFLIFLLVWVASPRYGLISLMIRRRWQQLNFGTQLMLGHVYNHRESPNAPVECAPETLHEHLNWSQRKTSRLMALARTQNWLRIEDGLITLTDQGEARVRAFREG